MLTRQFNLKAFFRRTMRIIKWATISIGGNY